MNLTEKVSDLILKNTMQMADDIYEDVIDKILDMSREKNLGDSFKVNKIELLDDSFNDTIATYKGDKENFDFMDSLFSIDNYKIKEDLFFEIGTEYNTFKDALYSFVMDVLKNYTSAETYGIVCYSLSKTIDVEIDYAGEDFIVTLVED